MHNRKISVQIFKKIRLIFRKKNNKINLNLLKKHLIDNLLKEISNNKKILNRILT